MYRTPFSVVILLASTLASSVVFAKDLKTVDERFSYAMGFSVMQNFKRQDIQIDVDAFVQAIQDIAKNKAPSLSIEQMQAAVTEYKQSMSKRQADTAAKNLKDGQAYIEEYKKSKDTKPLSDGIYYRVLKSGTGPSPKETDTVEVNYRGVHIDGTEFDSSYKRGKSISFPLNGVIKGWTIAVQKMKVGDKWQVVIPSELAYGSKGSPGAIGPNETLVFDIELLGIKK